MQLTLPRWEQLPKIDLYADQVLSYINPLCEAHQVKPLTKAMINNYVKLGLIPPPNKKRYERIHIAFLFVIVFLKEGFDISLIKDGILQETKRLGLKEAYDTFGIALHAALKNVEEVNPQFETLISPLMMHATLTIAHQKKAQAIIASQQSSDE